MRLKETGQAIYNYSAFLCLIQCLPIHPYVSEMGSSISEFGHTHCCKQVFSKNDNGDSERDGYGPSHLDPYCLQR